MNHTSTSLQNLASDVILKLCKIYAIKNNISIHDSIDILCLPYQIKKLLTDRMLFYYKYIQLK
jgi:hypothetical protein